MYLYRRLLWHKYVTSTTVAGGNTGGSKRYMRLRDNDYLARKSTVEGLEAAEAYKKEGMQRNYMLMVLCKVCLFVLFVSHICFGGMEEEEGVKYANRCEGKYMITEHVLYPDIIFAWILWNVK